MHEKCHRHHIIILSKLYVSFKYVWWQSFTSLHHHHFRSLFYSFILMEALNFALNEGRKGNAELKFKRILQKWRNRAKRTKNILKEVYENYFYHRLSATAYGLQMHFRPLLLLLLLLFLQRAKRFLEYNRDVMSSIRTQKSRRPSSSKMKINLNQ